MRNFIHDETLNKHIIAIRTKLTRWFVMTKMLLNKYYHKLNKRQKIGVFIIAGLLLLSIIVAIFSDSDNKKAVTDGKQRYPVHFESHAMAPQALTKSHKQFNALVNRHDQLQTQLSQLKDVSSEQYNRVKQQLQTIQLKMASLASQDDMQRLQQTMQAPNKAIAGQINNLQQDMQKIVKQTAKKTWVDPKTVEKYFRLVAVQGFSDGLRTIIDVDGNQTVLSVNQVCPVCRGWTLHSMDFANQSAVFSKTTNNQISFAKLQAN